MRRKRLIELLDRAAQTIAHLKRQDSSADRAPTWTKTALCVVVGIILLLFGVVDLTDNVKAPLYAMVAATALCVSLIPVDANHAGSRPVHYVVLVLSVTSSVVAAFFGCRVSDPLGML